MILRDPPTGIRRKILSYLKTEGPSDAAELAKSFDVTAMAVRQHLYDLQSAGFVEAKEEPRPKGRPAKLWAVTEEANRVFPDAHADLAVSLIASLKETLGDEGMAAIVTHRAAAQQRQYQEALGEAESLQGKLEILTRIRSAEGYMAAFCPEGDGYLFVENHCPICSAAKACTGLCALELEVFQAALGDAVCITREEHILAGARRCAYRITPQ